MKSGTSIADPSAHYTLRLYRIFIFGGGTAYLIWWKVVDLLLPQSFNPLGGRLALALCCWAVFVASFFFKIIARNLERWFHFCLWLITTHYFYLFQRNEADINWVVGAYIMVIAGCAWLQTEAALRGYAIWVLILSTGLVIEDPYLLHTIFFPGILTILAFAYAGLRSRARLFAQSQEKSQWLQNIYDAVFEGIVVHKEGRIVDANEAFARIFGYHRSEVIGMKVPDFVVPEARAFAMGNISAMSEAPYEVQGLRKDGSIISIQIQGKKHMVRGQALRLAAISDITSRKKSEDDRVLYESSQNAVKLRDEFLSIASHELKTPLTTIKIHTQMALRDLRKGGPKSLDPDKIARFIEQTDRQADRLNRLVEEMLDVSRISAGKLGIEREDFDLSELIQEVIACFDGISQQAGSPLTYQDAGAVTLHADRFRMEQVLSNLVSNAIKYGNHKPISIRVERFPKEVRILIEDQGIGIHQEAQGRIFERFERAISSRMISGLGLGLYISKQIVEAHGGRIQVSSQPDQGSRFTVALPC